jgi:hypothetical protein
MSETFTYTLNDTGGQDILNVTVDSTPSNSTGDGNSYSVTGITGTIDGVSIDGEVGSSGTVQTSNGYTYDNAIFISPTDGYSNSSYAGNTAGIDLAGLFFSIGGVDYNLYTENGTFVLSGTNGFNENPTLASTDAPCYCRGTKILTDSGEVAVEDLRIGDLVVTKSGEVKPIRWIGRRSYGGRYVAGNRNVLPVCIAQGALDEQVPARDLWVSPLHAMFLDGVLIPAQALVNGHSITQASSVELVEYFHIELAAHDVILAEGAWSESFIDDDSRFMFHNHAEFGQLYPDMVREPARFCAPRVEDGAELEAVRQKIVARVAMVCKAA